MPFAISRCPLTSLTLVISALSLGTFLATPIAHAQNPILANATYYYTGTATINTDLGNNDVVIGRSPGSPASPANDINLGTTPQTAYTVTTVAGAILNFSSQNAYTGVEVHNYNALDIQGGRFGAGVAAFDNSTINISSGQGLNSSSYNVNAVDNSTVNFNGAVYCGQIGASGTATLNVNGVNTNGIRLNGVIGTGNSTVNINATANINAISLSGTSALNFNAGRALFTDISSTGANKILGGTLDTLRLLNTGIVDVFGGVTSGLSTGGNGSSYAGTANIRGGTVSSISNSNFSTVNVFGGSIGSIQTFENSVTNIYGGTIAQNTLYAKDSGVVNVFGFGFSLSGIVGTGSDTNGTYNIYNLTGTLQDGTALQTRFLDYAGGNQIGGANSPLVFNAPVVVVPEAGTFALALPALGMIGAVIVRRCKK